MGFLSCLVEQPRFFRVALSATWQRVMLRIATQAMAPAAIRQTLSEEFPTLSQEIRGAVQSRESGGVIWVFDPDAVLDQSLTHSFSVAVAQMLGTILPETIRTDGRRMEPQLAVTIPLQHKVQEVGRLKHFADPELMWPLHTDRTLHSDVGDFLMVVKVSEHNAEGGRIRLLHIDDFEAATLLIQHPLAQQPLEWKGDFMLAPIPEQAWLKRSPGMRAPVFEQHTDGWHIRFTDPRFRKPNDREQADYLLGIDEALRAIAPNVPVFNLPVGGMYIVNNRTVLHGREGFRNSPGFSRTILRLSGNFL